MGLISLLADARRPTPDARRPTPDARRTDQAIGGAKTCGAT